MCTIELTIIDRALLESSRPCSSEASTCSAAVPRLRDKLGPRRVCSGAAAGQFSVVLMAGVDR